MSESSTNSLSDISIASRIQVHWELNDVLQGFRVLITTTV